MTGVQTCALPISTRAGRADLAPLSRAERHARAAELDLVVAEWTAGQDPTALTFELQAAGIAAHPVQHSTDCLADPQLVHRGHFGRAPHPVHGEVWVEGPTVRLSRTPGFAAWAGAPIGHHTTDVLAGFLGYDDARIAELVVAGAIR